MKKLLFVVFTGAIILLATFFIGRVNSDLSTYEYTLTLVSYPGDRIDLYEYVDYSDSHQGEEVFYLREVDENGELNIKLRGGKYAIWARCLEMSCQRSFDNPKVITLNKNKVIKLE